MLLKHRKTLELVAGVVQTFDLNIAWILCLPDTVVEETVRGRCRPAHEPYQGRIHEPYIGNEKMGSGCGERIKYQRHFVAALLSFRPYHLFATLNEQKLVFHTQDKQGCEESELGT